MTELGLIFAVSVLGLAFAGLMARWVLAQRPGDGDVARFAELARAAAQSFQRRQTSAIAAMSAALGGAIFLAYGLLRRAGEADPIPALELGVWLTASFGLGAALALASGHVATWTVTKTSGRAATASRKTLDLALQIALRGGAVSGIVLTAASVLGLASLVAAVFWVKSGFGGDIGAALRLAPSVPFVVAGYALGAAFAAFLAALGGGAFAKIADLGADLGGKAIGFDEDDPRNPATIADLAGDAASASARAAGIFASTSAETLAAMLLAGALFRDNASLKSAFAVMAFPLVARAFGVVAAMFGVMFVRTDDREDPSSALLRGLYITSTLQFAALAGAAKWLLGAYWLAFFGCAAGGAALAVALAHVVLLTSEPRYRPVRDLAEASRAGPTFVAAGGFALAIESAGAPLAMAIVVAVGGALLGASTGLVGGASFGVAVVTIGFIGAAPYVLATDALGAISDVARGVIEASVGRERPDARGRAAVLDGLGSSAKVFSRTFGSIAAALSSVLLVAVFVGEAARRAGANVKTTSLPLDRVDVYLGAFVGVALVAWTGARVLGVVARASRRVIDEVRRQAKDRPPGFVPDHETCLETISRAALGSTMLPAVVCACLPVAFGVLLRSASGGDNPLLAANAVAALVLAGTIAGVLGSLLLGNVGGAFDNAKKYIATGAHGGRHLVDETGARADNPTYLAALVADTIGDALKDAIAPAIFVLIKMLPVLVLVFLPFFL